MARKANWPPRVHPHRPSGQDRVRVQGHDYYLGPIGSPQSRAAYVELIRRLEAEGAGRAEPATATVMDVIACWSIHAATEHTVHEQDNYRHALRPLLDLHANVIASDLAGQHLRAVQQHMIATCRRSYINRCIGRIKTVWRWAEEAGHVPEGRWAVLSAVRPLSRPRPGQKETKVKPVEEWRVMRTALAAPIGLRRLILLGWHTGARPGELSRLTAEMIDRETWSAHLVEHKCAWRGHERIIWFGPEARTLLVDVAGLICPDGRGGRFNRRSLYQSLRRTCDRAGVERWTPYSLRHAFRVRMTPIVGIEATAALLGHRDISTTAQYGAGHDQALAREAARKAG